MPLQVMQAGELLYFDPACAHQRDGTDGRWLAYKLSRWLRQAGPMISSLPIKAVRWVYCHRLSRRAGDLLFDPLHFVPTFNFRGLEHN